jgi:hypothetical protein
MVEPKRRDFRGFRGSTIITLIPPDAAGRRSKSGTTGAQLARHNHPASSATLVRVPTFPLGHNAFLERQRNAKLLATLDAALAGNITAERAKCRLQGSPADLRGLPAVGRGVGGAIRGTQPEAELMRRQQGRR